MFCGTGPHVKCLPSQVQKATVTSRHTKSHGEIISGSWSEVSPCSCAKLAQDMEAWWERRGSVSWGFGTCSDGYLVPGTVRCFFWLPASFGAIERNNCNICSALSNSPIPFLGGKSSHPTPLQLWAQASVPQSNRVFQTEKPKSQSSCALVLSTQSQNVWQQATEPQDRFVAKDWNAAIFRVNRAYRQAMLNCVHFKW